MRNEMPINEIITRLGNVRKVAVASTLDADACATAISVLATLSSVGCADLNGVLDVIQDYGDLAKQYQAMHQKHEVAGAPVNRDGVWRCPDCNRAVSVRHPFCRHCGKRVGW